MIACTATVPILDGVERPPPASPEPRFRALLDAAAWGRLPAAIRRRFSHQVRGDESVVYRGRIDQTYLSRLGWLLAQLARLIGGPLPLENQRAAPTVVTVTRDPTGDGQCWSRQYHRHHAVPQVIRSIKRFAGPTGLEEHIGGGIGVALVLEATADRLLFNSDHYFVHCFGRRFRLPLPFQIEVTHRHINDHRFGFEMRLCNRRLGALIEQRAQYEELTV